MRTDRHACVDVCTYRGMERQLHLCLSLSLYQSVYLYPPTCIHMYVFLHAYTHVWLVYVPAWLCMQEGRYIYSEKEYISEQLGQREEGLEYPS